MLKSILNIFKKSNYQEVFITVVDNVEFIDDGIKQSFIDIQKLTKKTIVGFDYNIKDDKIVLIFATDYLNEAYLKPFLLQTFAFYKKDFDINCYTYEYKILRHIINKTEKEIIKFKIKC